MQFRTVIAVRNVLPGVGARAANPGRRSLRIYGAQPLIVRAPMTVPSLLLANAFLIFAMMLVLWVISVPLKDVSFIDAFWAFGFVLIAWFTAFLLDSDGYRSLLVCVLVTLWGLRLGIHLFRRWLSHGADQRYTAMIENAKLPAPLYTLLYIFLLQGVLMWIVSLPVQLGQRGGLLQELGVLALAGATLAVVGILVESIGDWQLARFKANPANRGEVMDRGLWRYTRHPNYFGDCCFWGGIFLIACEAPGGWMSLPGPVLMTLLLVKWSGAGLLEKGLKRSRPGYEEYIRRTSAFIPWPPST